MEKIKEKPKIDFTRNKLLQKIFKNYENTFMLTLDTEDFIEKKHLKKFRSYVWKDMRKSLRKVSAIARKQKRYLMLLVREKLNRELQEMAVKESAESEQSERIKSVSGLCSALDGQDCILKLTGQARACNDPCLLDCRLKLCSLDKLAGVCFAFANTPAVYKVRG